MKEPFGDIHGTTTVGARGQVVIPIEIREMYGIKPGDRLVVLAKRDKQIISFVTLKTFNDFLSHASKMVVELNKLKSKLGKKKR
jgi:AbrB family looped-hinge helix DNA binding protein